MHKSTIYFYEIEYREGRIGGKIECAVGFGVVKTNDIARFLFLVTKAEFSGFYADTFNRTYLGFGSRLSLLCYYIKHILILQSLDQNDNI